MVIPTPLLVASGLFAGQQGLSHAHQLLERHRKWCQALQAARNQAKPLLIVGRPRLPINHPCGQAAFGDVCLDLDPKVTAQCPEVGVIADVREIPFPNGHFGAAVAMHVLEHLPTMGDVELAWSELWRVAPHGGVFIAGPHKDNLTAWLIPDHYHWISQTADGGIWVEPRTRRIAAYLRAHAQGRILGPYQSFIFQEVNR